jgi:hypothetical protein
VLEGERGDHRNVGARHVSNPLRWRRGARRAGMATAALGFALLVPAGISGAAGATSTSSSGSAPTVEAARQVTAGGGPDRLFVLPQIAVDPANPNTVVVSVGNYRNGGCDLYASTNGGLSWANTTSSLLAPPADFCAVKPYGRYTQPVFTPDGSKLYVAMDAQATATETNGQNGIGGVAIASTTDLGLTHQTTVVQPSFSLPATVGKGSAKKTIQDPTSAREVGLAIDPTNPSYMYVAYDIHTTTVAGAPRVSFVQKDLVVNTSSNGGASWSAPILLPKDTTNPSAMPGAYNPAVVVGNNGDVYVFGFENLPPSAPSNAKDPVIMFKSSDHGKTWTTSTVNVGNNSTGMVEAAVSPVNGDIYVVWDGLNAVSSVSMQNATNAANQVFETTSSNGGATWSPTTKVGDAAGDHADQYYAGVSVSPNGRIDVAWYDFRNDPFHPQGQYEQYANIYYAYSTNNGATWSPNLRVSDRSMDTSLGVTFPYFTVGQIGVASSNNAAYITWGDPRNSNQVNQVEDAYMTRVDFTNPIASVSDTIPLGTKLEIGGAGAGALLILLGLGLVVGMARPGRRSASAAPAIAGSGPSAASASAGSAPASGTP